MKKILIYLTLLSIPGFSVFAAESTLFNIELSGLKQQKIYIPVTAELNINIPLKNRKLALYKISGSKEQAVPFQINENNQLSWLAKGADGTATYELRSVKKKVRFPELKDKSRRGLLTISYQGDNLLGYQYGHMDPPDDVDPAYGRSGFIHPLWSPKGQVLTRVQPDDHYHHYGIWNPWTHLEYDGKEYDLWNLVKKQGTVRYLKFSNRESGPVYSEYTAEHDHVIFPEGEDETIIMKELQTVRVYKPENGSHYIMDMTIDLRATTDKAVTLLEYRYGGFGWRATEQWHKDNSQVMSSEGLDRSKVDSTPGRWFYVQGVVDKTIAGAEVMSHPSNFNHPEPMRIWPVSDDNRGDVFASFSPTKNTDWLIQPEQNYVRRYRFVVYNDALNANTAELAWQTFAHPPEIKITSP